MHRYINGPGVIDSGKFKATIALAERFNENSADQPAIPLQVMRMDKAICELRQSIESLHCRLSPILKPPASSILRDEGKRNETCPLADTLVEMNDALAGVIQTVSDIHAAIQL